MAYFQHLMDQYGYWILSVGLMLEVLALPLPGEFLMSYAGLLSYQGTLNWPLAVAAAWLGSSAGMTAAYWIGYAVGVPFFEKVGPKIHLGPDKLRKVSVWFDRYGNKMLLIAYFIPGVRHFTGYFSGVTRLPFRTFSIYAYTGAFLWTAMFITLGKILGPQWEHYHHTIQKYLLFAGVLAVVVLIVAYVIRIKKLRWREAVQGWIETGYRKFRYPSRVGVLIGSAFVVFMTASAFAIGAIQDLLGHDFSEFDVLAPIVVRSIVPQPWGGTVMEALQGLSAPACLIAVSLVGFIGIYRKRGSRRLDFLFYAIGLIGGWLWETGLRFFFKRPAPDLSGYSFPSEQVMLTIVFYGLAAYFCIRSLRGWPYRYAIAGVAGAVCLLNGAALIYSGDVYPSDVTAACAFGASWIFGVILLFEFFGMLLVNREKARGAAGLE